MCPGSGSGKCPGSAERLITHLFFPLMLIVPGSMKSTGVVGKVWMLRLIR